MKGGSQSFEEVRDDMIISRELFLLLLQDPEIRTNLDEIDIPPDRAHLFDVLDADDRGSLQGDELVLGLLKIRGEAKRSDQVACLLAVKALHELLRNIGKKLDGVYNHLGLETIEAKRRFSIAHPRQPDFCTQSLEVAKSTSAKSARSAGSGGSRRSHGLDSQRGPVFRPRTTSGGS